MKAVFGVAISILLVIMLATSNVYGQSLEDNTDRPGMDYKSFDLPAPDPQRCQHACMNDAQCKAFTYVKPGVQGAEARCWLKSGVPNPVPSRCCMSGTKASTEKATPIPLPGPQPATPIPLPGPQDATPIPLPGPKQAPPGAPSQQIAPQQGAHPGQLPGPQSPGSQAAPRIVPGPAAQQFHSVSAGKLTGLNSKERQLNDALFAKARQQIKAQWTSASQSQAKPGPIEQTCGTPQIHSVYPTTVKPGMPLLLKGCGFPTHPKIVMYDPTGKPLGASSPTLTLLPTQASPTMIEVTVPRVGDGLRALKGTEQVFVRVWDDSTKQYGSPSPALTLQPNMAVYLCRQSECYPKSVQANGTQVIADKGGTFTAQVYHLPQEKHKTFLLGKEVNKDPATIAGSIDKMVETEKKKEADPTGVDVLIENLKLPEGWKFHDFDFGSYNVCGKYPDKVFQECKEKPEARLQEDVGKSKGERAVPKASVRWRTGYPPYVIEYWWGGDKTDKIVTGHFVGTVYVYSIYVYGPEGWGSIPFE